MSILSIKSGMYLKSALIIWLIIIFKPLFNWCFAVCRDWTHLSGARLSLQSAKTWHC